MSENVYRRAPVPFYYGLVFLLNVVLIIAMELLLVYTTPTPLTVDALAQKDSVYEEARLLNGCPSSGSIYWYLAETQDHEIHVVPIRRHTLFMSRCKILTDQIVPISQDASETEVMTRAGISGSTVIIGRDVESIWDENTEEEALHMRPKWFGASSEGKYVFAFYFLTAVVLSFLEAFLWHKIKG